jgi:hypothetical protein
MKKLLTLLFLFSFFSPYSQVRIGSYDGDSHAVVYNNGWGDGDSYIHIGNNAGFNANSTGTYFTNIGYAAGRYNSSMNFNVHLGYAAGNKGTEAIKNVAIGAYAMYADSGSYMTGDNSTSVGHESMYNISSGYNNSGLGYQSFYNLTTGYNNTALGYQSLYNLNNGYGNLAVGLQSGDNLVSGTYNTFLGLGTDASSTSAINQTMIGYAADGQADNSVTLGNSDVTAIYMAEDSGATVYAAGLNLGGTAVTSTAAELNLLDGVTTVGSGILSSVTENSNTGVRLSSSSASNHGDIGSYAVDLSYSASSSSSYGATGDYSTAMGYGSTASGIRSFAGGLYTVASGGGSFAFHSGTIASGTNSTALGRVTVASDYASVVIGQYNSSGSSATSANSFSTSAPAFVIGNGADSSNKSDAFKVMFNGDATVSNDLTVSGDVVISSDARLKSNIVSLGSTLSKLLQIDGKSYEMKGKQKIGVLAQEIKEVFPELVSEDDNEMLAVNYQGLVPVLINALKEQQSEIDELKEQETKFEKQQAEIDELKEMVNQLTTD